MKTLNTVENKHDARLAYAISGVIDALPAMIMLLLAVLLMLAVTGCATGPFQARKQAWARANCRTYGWEPVYLGGGETRYAPSALTRQIKSADSVAMKVAAGELRSISEAELPGVVDQGGAWWAKTLDTSLAAIAAGAATWGAIQLAQGINNDQENNDSSTRIDITGDSNAVTIQTTGTGNNSNNRDTTTTTGGEGSPITFNPEPAPVMP